MKSYRRLRLAATLWSLAGHPSLGREWTLGRKIAEIKRAGFEGVQSVCRPGLSSLLREHKLAWIAALDATNPAKFEEQVGELKRDGALIANAQIGEHDTSAEEGAKLAVSLLAEAERQGVRIQIETHRDTATETPEKFHALAAHFHSLTGQTLPVTWDHSHFALIKHLRPDDFTRRLLDNPAWLQNSRLIHCRPFNGHHCQIPVTDRRGRKTPEFRDWLVFVRVLLQQWREGAPEGAELWIVPEQGAAFNGYNLSVFNSPWHDAIVCARALRAEWRVASLCQPRPA